jgi:hypothetical protein
MFLHQHVQRLAHVGIVDALRDEDFAQRAAFVQHSGVQRGNERIAVEEVYLRSASTPNSKLRSEGAQDIALAS